MSVGMGSLFGGVRPGIVLSLCDRTGNMVRPWADAGYECWIVDMQHPEGEHRGDDGIVRVGADVSRWLPPRRDYAICFAFPPCTHFAVSGARWFRDKGLAALHEGIGLVEACRRICEWTDAPWMLENPVGTLATYWRPPDYTFQPHHFAGLEPSDNYTKQTCLWTGGGFVMPEGRPDLTLGDPDNRIHFAAPGPQRANFRSATPMGFARAVFSANRPAIQEAA